MAKFWKKNKDLVVSGTLATVIGGLLLSLGGLFQDFFANAYAQLGIYDYYAGMDIATALLVVAGIAAIWLFIRRRKKTKRKQLASRRSLAIFIIIVALIVSGGIGLNIYHRLHSKNVFTVVIAQFDGADPKEHMISQRLEKMINDQHHTDIQVILLPETIASEKQATRIGKQHHANVVIRGFYHNDEPKQIIAYAHLIHDVTIDQNVIINPTGESILSGMIDTTITTSGTLTFGMAVDHMNAGVIQLSSFLIGVNQINKEEWPAAERSFAAALAQSASAPLLTRDILLYFRGLTWLIQDKLDNGRQDLEAVVASRANGVTSSMRSNAHHALGYIAKDAKKYADAEAHYTQAIVHNNRSVGAYISRGITRGDLKKYDEALKDFDKAIVLAKDIDAPYGYPYNGRGVIFYMQDKKDEALREFDKAIALDKKNVNYLANKGVLLTEKNQFTQAIELFDKAIKIEPNQADLYFKRGFAYERKGNTVKAVNDYTTAIKYNPRYIDPYNNRGAIYLEAKEFDKAIKDFDRALSVDPADVDLYINRSLALYSKGIQLMVHEATKNEGTELIKKAAADAETSIKLNPEMPDGYVVIGQIHLLNGEEYYAQALEAFNQAIERDDRNGKVYAMRGLIFAVEERYDEALADYNAAITFNPRHPDAYLGRARLKMGLEFDLEGALADYNTAAYVAPQDPKVYLERAHFYHMMLQDENKARKDAEKVIELAKNSPEAAKARDILAEL
ncbi:MAG TPA: tetratricopeptide repeat protein [Candidatus Saccharimonadales bacterium]|nr:tetratricopeptide repeat protein [Candidatus Saccharimonadales bacterium]